MKILCFKPAFRKNIEEVSKTKHWNDFQSHCPILVEEIYAQKPTTWII